MRLSLNAPYLDRIGLEDEGRPAWGPVAQGQIFAAVAGGAAEDAKRITKGQTHSSLICVDALGDYWY